jgi:hypothetical protein
MSRSNLSSRLEDELFSSFWQAYSSTPEACPEDEIRPARLAAVV